MGSSKAELSYRGEPMLERVAAALQSCLCTVRVVLRPGQTNPTDLPRIDDQHAARAAMIGIASALRCAETDAVLVAACDLPELDPRIVLALLAQAPLGDSGEIVAPLGPGGPEPLLAIYRVSLLPELERRIAAEQFGLRSLFDARKTHAIPTALLRELDPSLASLHNVNRPEDLPQPEGDSR